MENEIVASLDIGTTKIACIVGRRTEHGKVEILGYGKTDSVGVSRGVVTNIVSTVESIKRAVEEASTRSGVDIKIVNVGIAGQHIRSYQHRGIRIRSSNNDEISQPDIDALIEDMFRLVMQPGEEIIHVLPQEYIIDNEQGITKPIGMSGIRLEANFHVITGQVTAANNIKKCVEKAGLEVSEIILEPLASSEAVLSEDEKEAGVVLVDIGGGTTDIAIFKDGIIRHTAVIPFGGNVITEDIQEGCTIIKLQAEALKTKFGSAFAHESLENQMIAIPGLRGREPKEISQFNLACIIQARMTEIIDYVDYEIKNSGYKRKLIAGIVVTGGGAMMKNLPQLFEYSTGMPTRIGYPNEHLAKGMVEEVTSPMFATGVGLLIKGLDKAEKSSYNMPFSVEEEQPLVIKEEKITGHSKKDKKGTFFENLFKKAENWLADEDK